MALGRAGIIYGSSFLLHAGVAFALVHIEPPKVHEATTVSVVHTKSKKEKAPEPGTPPPPEPIAPPLQQRPPKMVKRAAAPAPPPEAAPAPAEAAAASSAPSSNVPMFGLTLSGGVGSGPGGIAVPVGNSLRAPQATTKKTAAPKALLAPKKTESPAEDACLEALVKPKPISIEQPKYADRAREAGIQGKVRVELTVDENGEVVDAKVIESLGYGLDEAALEAARKSRFEAATRCGQKTRTTFVIGIRFAL